MNREFPAKDVEATCWPRKPGKIRDISISSGGRNSNESRRIRAKTKDTEAHRKTIGATLIPRLPIPAINYVEEKRVESSAGVACPVSIFTGYSHPFSLALSLSARIAAARCIVHNPCNPYPTRHHPSSPRSPFNGTPTASPCFFDLSPVIFTLETITAM